MKTQILQLSWEPALIGRSPATAGFRGGFMDVTRTSHLCILAGE